MPEIALSLVKSSPFRDFDLHPIDPEQVDKLKASIDADGFWASVVARPVGKHYEIAYGHHRVEAARDLGMAKVPIEVRELTDLQMVRMLASENATQRGNTAAACLDAVAAIAKVLAYNLLRWENEATFGRNCPKVPLNFPSCRGRLEAGEGIGRDCILAFAPRNSLTEHQVGEALNVLRESGRLADIIATAHGHAAAELQAEHEAAEHELEEAQQREAAARTKREREAAAKETTKAKKQAATKQKASAGAGKAVVAAKRVPIIFDARCTKLFKVETHAEVFRKIVTGETFQAYLPLSGQYDFAKSVIAALRESKGKREITAQDIRAECWSRIETGLGINKGKLRTAPERPYLEEIKEGLNLLRRSEGDFKRGVALLIRGFQLGEQLDAKQAERLTKTENTFMTGWNGLKEYRTPKQHLRLIGEDVDE